MQRALILPATIASLAIFLVSCGVKKTAAPPLGDLAYSSYSSCQASANSRHSPGSGGVIDSGYFGKLIDRGDMNAILPADSQQTAAHASIEQLAIYIVNQGQCSAFSFLPQAPSHVYEYWKQAAGSAGISSLLGLYKEDCRDGCKPDQVINPLVMLNSCTDRWTMVHELLHHNFNVQRKKFKPLDSDEAIIAVLTNELDILQNTVDAYNRGPEEYLGMQLVHSLDRVRDLLVRFTYQTSFEEVSIESMLMREFAIGRLKQVPGSAVKNAISYVRYSASAGIDRVAPIKIAAEDLARSAMENGWERVASNAKIVKARIDNFEDDSTCYQNEAVDLYRKASIAANPPPPPPEEEQPGLPEEIEWSLRIDDAADVDREVAISTHVDSRVDARATEVTNEIKNVLSRLKRN